MGVRSERKPMTVWLLGGLAVAALLLSSCGSSDSSGSGDASTTKAEEPTTTKADAPKANPEVDGKAFTSTSVTGMELVEGTEIQLAFDGDHLSASAGCNTMGASYAWVDDTLSWVGPAMGTMMACEDAIMAQETWLSEALTAGMGATLDGDSLTLTSDDVTVELTASTDNPLVGTTWELQGTVANEAMTPVNPNVTTPSLEIAEDGSVSVFTGCNNGSTTVEIGEDTLTFAPIAMTKMFCEGAPGQLETKVVSVLDGEVTYVTDGDTLTISNGDTGLVFGVTA